MRRVRRTRARRRGRAAALDPRITRLKERTDEFIHRGRKFVRQACLRAVWNEPIRPKFVPLPVVAGTESWYVFRSFLIALFFGVGASFCGGPGSAAAVRAAGVTLPAPMLGFYSFGDFVALAATRATDGSAPAILLNAGPVWLWFGVGFSCGLTIGLIAFRSMLYKIPKHILGTERHNEWASLADLYHARLIGHNEPGMVCGSVDVPPLFGFIPQAPEILVYPGPQHVELSASSGSGKDVVLACTDGFWPYSMVTSDAKAEQYQLGGGRAAGHDGKDVYFFNPGASGRGEEYVDEQGEKHVELFGSNSWNLLDEIPWGAPDEGIVLRTYSGKVVAKSEKEFEGDNGHWIRLAQSMFMVGSYKVRLDPEETRKSVTRVAQVIALGEGIPGQTKISRPSEGGDTLTHETLESLIGFSVSSKRFGSMPTWVGRVEQEITLRMQLEIEQKKAEIGRSASEAEVDAFIRLKRRETQERIDRFRSALRHPDMETLLAQLLKIKGDEAASAYSSFNQCMGPWLSENIERNTMTSDFNILGIVNGPRPAHLYLGNNMATRGAVLRIHQILMSLALTKWLPNMAMDQQTKLIASPWANPCILRLNELDAMGEIPELVAAVPLLRSYRIYYFGAYQTRAQLDKTYGEAERKIITNQCDVQMFHTPGDDDEAEQLSKGLGERTTVRRETSHSNGTRSVSYKVGTVALMDPTQVSMIPKLPEFEFETVRGVKRVKRTRRPAYQIIRAKGCPPIYARKEQWFNENFRWLADEYRRYGLAPIVRSDSTLADLRRRHALSEGTEGLEQERKAASVIRKVRGEVDSRVEAKPLQFDSRNARVTRRARRKVTIAEGVRVVRADQ